jgi:hypothetical protein
VLIWGYADDEDDENRAEWDTEERFTNIFTGQVHDEFEEMLRKDSFSFTAPKFYQNEP